ncbi:MULTISPECIES: hypothetical protein [unclassified Oleiphilus]|nr:MULTISPECIES: hypothetical protein [unclassified Oleiphilus]KZY44969.1 hypothetical protein A3732_11375 [Oleiphilus sp. HI0050]KZY76076.1 hypothetical protein A3740_13820 [Oleiphilus sp. HI0068]KZY85039.1 hypothetical protein A3743_03560 [Oleiphilus sp. HI0072]KZY85256.1 hypothetical protein A3741_15550 [Oleiphilus sp. HI0069]KZZ21363.1 hypothetical protein A3752_01130 [Oleiphilus sp. HI0081]KZZ31491.1 hypothetical protein A3755_01705 [Oleiphilus sp. HI0085]
MMNVLTMPDRLTKSQIKESFYRTYKLVNRVTNGVSTGEVFKQGERVAYCEGLDSDEPFQYLKGVVDSHIRNEIRLRENSMPDLTAWYRAICETLPIESRKTNDIICELFKAGREYVSLSDLAGKAEISNTSELCFLLSNLARKMCDSIPYEPPCQGDGRDAYLALICDSSPLGDRVRLNCLFSTIFKDYWHK